jgi:hypothetical protein
MQRYMICLTMVANSFESNHNSNSLGSSPNTNRLEEGLTRDHGIGSPSTDVGNRPKQDAARITFAPALEGDGGGHHALRIPRPQERNRSKHASKA